MLHKKRFCTNFHIPFLICLKEEAFSIISISHSYLSLLASIRNDTFYKSSYPSSRLHTLLDEIMTEFVCCDNAQSIDSEVWL